MAKYEFVNNDYLSLSGGRKITRIRALHDNVTHGVKEGDFGGYIEREHNLSQEGNAWVFPGATVYERARVYDNGAIKGSASARGHASIAQNAVVGDSVELFDYAVVAESAELAGRTKVGGAAHILGESKVSADTRIDGCAYVRGKARIHLGRDIFWVSCVGSENGTLTAYRLLNGGIEFTRGCFNGSAEEFLERNAKYSNPRIRREYELLIELAISRIKGE